MKSLFIGGSSQIAEDLAKRLKDVDSVSKNKCKNYSKVFRVNNYKSSNIKKILPDLNDLNFIEKVKNQLVMKQKIDYNKKLFLKIQDKKFSNAEFLNIAENESNIKKLKINSSNFDETFSRESVELLYSLPKKSFVLIADKNNDVYLSKISNINTSMLNKDADKINEYKLKSNSQVMGEIYSTYDLSLSKKYNVKLFNSTLERIKNNFR